jgi:cytochrome c biogenesis protein CcdA/glutaredoxin
MKKSLAILATALILLSTPGLTAQNNTTVSSEQVTELNRNLTVQDTTEKPTIVFFYSTTCPHCDHIEEYLDDLNSSEFELKKHQASTNSEKFSAYIENHSVPARYAGAVPTVFIGEDSAVGSRNAINLIERKLSDETEQSETQEKDEEETPEQVQSDKEGELSGIGLIGFLGLAATDSINPCALAVLLILVGSIMSGNLEDQIKALKAGASFTAGIFASYFLMGVLLIFGIKSVQEATAVGIDSIYLFFGGFAILIGLLNIKDWFSHGLGGFAMEVPFSWRPKMKSYLKKVTGPAGAFVTALIVSLFLLPCTSGPYFVAGGLLSGTSWTTAIPLLLLYNLIFIAPMLAIIGVLYYGATEVDRIQEWRKENIEELHLVAGLILLLLGTYLLVSTGV